MLGMTNAFVITKNTFRAATNMPDFSVIKLVIKIIVTLSDYIN